MIRSFASKETEKIWSGKLAKGLPATLQARAMRKLQLIDAAVQLEFLKLPPGNKLEPLKGDRAGQHSIRINDQWRICFVWTGSDAEAVEIVDYH